MVGIPTFIMFYMYASSLAKGLLSGFIFFFLLTRFWVRCQALSVEKTGAIKSRVYAFFYYPSMRLPMITPE